MYYFKIFILFQKNLSLGIIKMFLLGASQGHFNFGIIQSTETLPQTPEDMRPDAHSSKLECDGKYA